MDSTEKLMAEQDKLFAELMKKLSRKDMEKVSRVVRIEYSLASIEHGCDDDDCIPK
jgi:hypothetical protein